MTTASKPEPGKTPAPARYSPGTGLFAPCEESLDRIIQPHFRETEVLSHRPCFAVYLGFRDKHSINIPCHAHRIVGEGHRRTTDKVHLPLYPFLNEPFAQLG